MPDSLSYRLRDLAASDIYPFHMPGHKRISPDGSCPSWYESDVSEISGFDDLHHPSEILLTAQRKAAALYQAEESFFLVGGGSAGILAAVAAVCAGGGKKLLISRHSHQSVYHAAYLCRTMPTYIYPAIDEAGGLTLGVSAAEVAAALANNPDIAAVLVTSPTYEGICADVAAIAETAHRHGVPLIVDQAHGSHFGLHPALPSDAVAGGADIVIHSLHKTLPSPTQTALLHVCGGRVERSRLRRFLRMYQSSSPSYPLMAGIERCLDFVAEQGKARFDDMLTWRQELVDRVGQCKRLRILAGGDPCKIVVLSDDGRLSGRALCAMLREKYHIEMEMAGRHYAVAIVTIMDRPEGFARLAAALTEIDGAYAAVDDGAPMGQGGRWRQPCRPEAAMTIHQAMDGRAVEAPLADAVGRIAADFISPYPPGIPLLVPGERIDEGMVRFIGECQEEGLIVNGLAGDKIWVCA